MRYPQSNQLPECQSQCSTEGLPDLDWENRINPPGDTIPTNLTKNTHTTGQTWIAPKSGVIRLVWNGSLNNNITSVLVTINDFVFYSTPRAGEGEVKILPVTKGNQVKLAIYSTVTHGDKRGIQNTLSLLAQWDAALPDPITWTYTLPSGTFKSTVAGGGTVPNGSAPATSAALFPYGRGHRVQASDTYSLRTRWQVVFPIKGTLAAISNFAVNNVFNTQINNQPTTNWTAGTTRIWQNGQKPGEEGDPLWGKNVAARTGGENWGVYSSGGARNFNVNVDFGIRF